MQRNLTVKLCDVLYLNVSIKVSCFLIDCFAFFILVFAETDQLNNVWH